VNTVRHSGNSVAWDWPELSKGHGMNTKKIRKLLATGAVSLVSVAMLSGCSSKSKDAMSTEASRDAFAAETEAAAMVTEAPAATGAVDFSGTAADAGPITEAAASAEPANPTGKSTALPDLGVAGTYLPIGSAQIKRAEVTLAIPTAKFNAAVAQLTSLPGAVGGFITSSTFGGGEEFSDGRRAPRSGVVVMRVPSNEFDGVRKRLPSFGATISEQISGEEVSAQLVDLNARLTSLRLQEDSYRKLFDAAKQIQDIITVQERITEVRTQIEQIGAQRASLQNQVAMSTITVNVREKMAPRKDDAKPKVSATKKSFGSKTAKAWKSGLSALTTFLTTVVVIVAVLAPFLPFVAVIALLGWVLVRRRRQHSVVPAAPSAPSAPTAPSTPVTPVRATAPTEREETLV
jgi:Domain of unknown function (DUF4349)